ncbi:MAG: recombinase family protein [Leucobacter sp.]|nr:recombinase family protein [Leucobacter sp.]
MMKVAAYVRISKDAEGERWGVETQRKLIAERAEHEGWQVHDWYEDNDTSASKRRGAKTRWAAMLRDAEAGLFEVVVAVDVDRLVRGPRDLLTLIDLDLKVVTVDGEIDLTSADGEFRATMLAAMARFEVRRKGERTIRSNERRRAEGLPILSGKTPFGYTKTGALVADQAAAVEQAFADFLSDPPLSIASIAKGLNAAGHKTTRGTAWSPYAVRYLLSNALYAGFIEYHATGELFPVKRAADGGADRFPAIVSEDTWKAARAKLAANVGRTTKRGNQPKYLLSGVAVCGRCGAKMVAGQNERGVPNYRCGAKFHVSRQRELVDAKVNEAAITRLCADDAREYFETGVPGPGNIDAAALRSERAVLRARQDDLRPLMADPDTPIATIKAAISDLQERIAEIDGLLVVPAASPGLALVELGETLADASERRQAVEAAWWALDVDRRRQIVDSIMTVTIEPIVPGHTRFNPELIRVE